MKFSGNGVFLATGSFDKKIYVWEVYGECPHTMTLNGHKNAVQEVHWSTDSETIFSASADKTGRDTRDKRGTRTCAQKGVD